MKIKCIIVEDEPLAMERMVGYVQKIAVLELMNSFDNAMDAYNFLQLNETDLIFLDINLGEISGIQLLESTQIKAEVIITTAYPEFALKGFDLNVTDYLLKPFVFERFLQAIDKVIASVNKKKSPESKTFFFVKTENRLERILLEDVLFIEGMRDYRKIHTISKKIMTLQTFAELETILPAGIICRVHKSWMVALNKIETIEKDKITIQNQVIPVSETYRQQFFELVGR